jgi:integrase/recombinase XerD
MTRSLAEVPYHPHIQHTDLGTTSTYLQGIDPSEIVNAVHSRRPPMMPASAALGR